MNKERTHDMKPHRTHRKIGKERERDINKNEMLIK